MAFNTSCEPDSTPKLFPSTNSFAERHLKIKSSKPFLTSSLSSNPDVCFRLKTYSPITIPLAQTNTESPDINDILNLLALLCRRPNSQSVPLGE